MQNGFESRLVVDRRPLRLVLSSALLAVLSLLLVAGQSVRAQTTIDWTNVECGGAGWTDPPLGAAGPAAQTFTNIGCTGVDMTVTYSGNMWDNNSTPNIYGSSAPVAQLAGSLRWTNNRRDVAGPVGSVTGPATMSIQFSEPVLIDEFTVVSLSHFMPPSTERYEWAELRGYDGNGNLLTTTSYTPSTWDTSGALVTRANSPMIVDNNSGVYYARGTSIQSTNCGNEIPLNSCGYDRFTVAYQTSPVKRFELIHFATLGSTLSGARSPDRTSIAIEPFAITVPPNLLDWGDAPDTGAGTGPGNYNTLAADNGPSHVVVDELYLGVIVDDEADGQPTTSADGDDTNPPAAPDDEEGVSAVDLAIVEGEQVLVGVMATNLTGRPALLYGWIDFNGNGLFEASEAANATVSNGSNQAQITLDFGIAPANGLGLVYSRFRLSTDDAATLPIGPAVDGEVEDYAVAIAAAERLDWGDAPDAGVAPGPGSYNTLANNSGPSHSIVAGLFMGSLVDPEGDGQPSSNANGDDMAPSGAPDDEDGAQIADLVLLEGNNATVLINATNLTGAVATLYGWIDFDGDGLFEPSERASIAVPNGTNDLSFTLDFGTVPANGLLQTFARFRLSTDAAASTPIGPAGDGEVEDHVVSIRATSEVDRGDAPDSYGTLAASGGPAHRLGTMLHMGAIVDADEDGQPTLDAGGDDANPAGAPDDEDGVDEADLALVEGKPAQVRVTVTNQSDSVAVLYGWIDFNGNGAFELEERAQMPVLANTAGTVVVLDFGTVPSNGVVQSYARFRLSTGGAAANPTGVAQDGEIEDYPVSFAVIYDWGDAPDSGPGTSVGNYNTLAGSNGPTHKVIGGLYIGNVVDGEVNGQATVNADGDDTNPSGALDDEDGVAGADLNLSSVGNALINVSVTNLTAKSAVLYGWIDFNGNGLFEPSESAQSVVSTGVNNGAIVLDFGLVPSDGALTTYARFRLSTDNAASSPIGPANDGEVEDYIVTISSKPSAVELAYFTATYDREQEIVTIEWATSLELDSLGFHVYRSLTGSRNDAKPVNVSLIPASGISGGAYSAVDSNANRGNSYTYWLVEVTTKSEVHEYGPTYVAIGPATEGSFSIFLPYVRTR